MDSASEVEIMCPLMIIDLQEFFLRPFLQHVVDAIVHQIRWAKKRKAPIIMVNCALDISKLAKPQQEIFTENPPPSIKCAIARYSDLLICRKNQDDVTPDISSDVLEVLEKTKKLRVVGLNTNVCVQKSVLGLRRKFSHMHFEIIRSACGNNYQAKGNGAFAWAERLSRIEVKQPSGKIHVLLEQFE